MNTTAEERSNRNNTSTLDVARKDHRIQNLLKQLACHLTLKMSYLHPYSDVFLHPSFHLVFLTCLVFHFPSRTTASTSAQAAVTAGSGNVDLVFPTFNGTTFSCTGTPNIVGYVPCKYNLGGSLNFLPPKFNNLYPNQSARLMYKNSVEFNVPSHLVANVNFSTFILFQVSHVPNKSTMGAGFAFIIAPTIDTPVGSEGGGLGLYANNTIPPITSPGVIAIEFDTSFTPGIDEEGVGLPHIALDDGILQSVNLSVVGSEFLDTPVGMWIDYDDNASTLSVYSTPVQGKMDASAASLKPKTPLFTQEPFNVFATTTDFKRGYIGISGGIDNGGWESNIIFYWRFTTTGYPPPAALSSWYVWYGNLSTTSKLAVIVGGVLGTLAGAFGCSECVFHLLCQRVKKPSTTEEKIWPYHWRTSLPGTRTTKVPPRKKVRDSLSVTTPLYLWEAPAEPEWKHGDDVESRMSPEAELSDDQAPLISPTSNTEQGYNQESQVDTPNKVDFVKSPDIDALVEESLDTDATVEVAGEDVESQAQELEQSSMVVQEAVNPAEERPPEVVRKAAPTQGLVSAPAREKAPAGKETKPMLPTETKALIKKKPVQAPEKKPELGTKTGLELGKKVAPLIEKKLIQAPEKKPEQEVKTELKGIKKAAPLIEKKPVQAGDGSAPIESPKVPAQAEKGVTPARKAMSSVGKTQSQGIQKPRASDRRVSFEAGNPSASAQQRPVPAEKKASPMAVQPSSPAKQGPTPAQTKESSQAVQPSSPPKQGPLPAEKKVSPLAGQPSSPPKHGPLSAERKVLPLAGQPSSPPKESPLPLEMKVSPLVGQPSSPKQGPLPAEKKVSPLAGKPNSQPKQGPLPAEKKASPLAGQPNSPPKQGPLQGAKKATSQAGHQKGAPAVTEAQKSPLKGPGPPQIPKLKLLKGPRQSPQISPRNATPRGSHKAVPRPSPQTSPRNTTPLGPVRGPQLSPQTSQKALPRPSPVSTKRTTQVVPSSNFTS